MKTALTPRELADALAASESSVRRWVDSGDIRLSRTAGGHRRIPVPEAIRFIRAIGAPVVRPELLGLGDLQREDARLVGLSDDQKLFESLSAGDRRAARGLVLAWYLDGRPLAGLFDGPFRSALDRLGELWEHDRRGILVEHRATAICVETVATLLDLLPVPDDHAPLALGAAPEGDPYQLPTMMASAVLTDAGFRTVNFGASTPVELLGDEAQTRGARLVWLSISAPPATRTLKPAVRELADRLQAQQVPLVVGGRHQREALSRDAGDVQTMGSMTELAAFARGLIGAT